jgi:phosphoglycerol transferase MdoB-like AlkP superfamily enzyme
MIKRLVSLMKYYLSVLAVFIIEKPLFMIYAGGLHNEYKIEDYLSVVYHGLPIDVTMAGYLIIFPFLLVIISSWWQGIPYKRLMKVYNVLIALLLALVFIGDAAVYPFWGFKLDASIFFYLKTPKEALASVSLIMALLGFLITGILAFLLIKLLGLMHRDMFPVVKKRIRASVLMIVLLVPLFISIRGGVEESTMNIGRAYFSTYQFLNHSAVNPCFSLLSSLGKSEDYASMNEYFEEDVRAELFNGLYEKGDSSTLKLLNTTRPNILLIIMEGFGGDFIGSLGGQPGVSPRLDSLANEGVFFSNCYAGSYRTDRGVVCIMNGHPGLPTVSLMKLPIKSRTLPSLPRKFAENGYSTDFLYGGDINFTNMQSYLWSNGYQKITSDVDFSAADKKTGAWGVTDKIMFDYLLNKLKDRKDSLWHTAFLTLSSHEPFEVPYHRLDDKICNSFAYTDSCIGALVDSLKKTPIWDNLLIVLVPDHGFCYPQEGNRQLPHVHRIPIIWVGGAVSHHQVVDDFVSQSDLAATLLAQMDIEHSDFLFSRNVLSSDYKNPFAFYTFNNGLCYIDSTGISLFDNDSKQSIMEEGKEGSENRLNKGKSILQTLMDDLGSR